MIRPFVLLAAASLVLSSPARAQSAADPATGPATDPATESRLRELETQVRALTEELRRLHGQPAPAPGSAPAAAPASASASASVSVSAPASVASDARTEELERKVDAIAEEMTSRRAGISFDQPLESRWGLGPAASKVYGAEKGVSIGGYGEVLWQGFDSTRDDGARSDEKDTLDALRAVLYFGYKFSDRIVFNSEIEFEHGNTERGGAVEVEFLNVDFLVHDAFNARAGMVLVPVGLLNELHEPTTFWSARRPQVENVIIPSTWSENGFGFFGEKGPVSWRAYVVAGLDATGFSAAKGIREGRQAGAESLAEDLAVTARVDFDPVPGLELGLSGFHGNSGQDEKVSGVEIDVPVTLWDAHLSWQWRGLGLRALYTRAEIGDVTELNALLGLGGADSVGSRLEGWYGEIGYDVLSRLDTKQELIPFVRHEEFDTQARVPAGFLRDPSNDRTIDTFGFVYKPHPQVIIKLDYQDIDNGADTGIDQYNLAVGYSF